VICCEKKFAEGGTRDRYTMLRALPEVAQIVLYVKKKGLRV
jgi:hypothetical protein